MAFILQTTGYRAQSAGWLLFRIPRLLEDLDLFCDPGLLWGSLLKYILNYYVLTIHCQTFMHAEVLSSWSCTSWRSSSLFSTWKPCSIFQNTLDILSCNYIIETKGYIFLVEWHVCTRYLHIEVLSPRTLEVPVLRDMVFRDQINMAWCHMDRSSSSCWTCVLLRKARQR